MECSKLNNVVSDAMLNHNSGISVSVFTGVEGMDTFSIILETEAGLKRHHVPQKNARIFSKRIKISVKGYKYKLVKL